MKLPFMRTARLVATVAAGLIFGCGSVQASEPRSTHLELSAGEVHRMAEPKAGCGPVGCGEGSSFDPFRHMQSGEWRVVRDGSGLVSARIGMSEDAQAAVIITTTDWGVDERFIPSIALVLRGSAQETRPGRNGPFPLTLQVDEGRRVVLPGYFQKAVDVNYARSILFVGEARRTIVADDFSKQCRHTLRPCRDATFMAEFRRGRRRLTVSFVEAGARSRNFRFRLYDQLFR